MGNKAIVFVLDDKYADPARMAIRDVWSYSGEKYPVIVMHGANLSERWRGKMKSEAGGMGMDLRFHDISTKGEMFQGIKCNNHVSDVTYAKLLMGELFWDDPKIHTAYYFDVDILVLRDLSALFKIVPKKAIAAVDHNMPEHYRMLNDADGMYINAGVIVANLVRWNTINALEKFKTAIQTKSDRFLYNDQDIFSAALIDEIEELPEEYNFLINPRVNRHMTGTPLMEWDESKISPAIVHYIGPQKPWSSGINTRVYSMWRDRRKRFG